MSCQVSYFLEKHSKVVIVTRQGFRVIFLKQSLPKTLKTITTWTLYMGKEVELFLCLVRFRCFWVG